MSNILDVLKPQDPPEPKGVTYRHHLMKVYGADDHLPPEQRREKRLEEMRARAKEKR